MTETVVTIGMSDAFELRPGILQRPGSPNHSSEGANPAEDRSQFTNLRKITVITHLAGANFANNAINGPVTVGLPP